MTEQDHRRMTVEEFLDWDDGTDTRHMLVDGAIVAMAPPSSFHSRIASNVAFAIQQHLKPSCGALVEAGVKLASDTCVQADVAMTCEQLQPRKLMEQPVLLVEVLSPSTSRTDFGVKILGYQELLSVLELWAVDSEERSVRVWRRAGIEWIMTLPIRAGGFWSEILGDQITLDELYEGTGL
jgi:Uma2 family endonuclease